MIINICTGLFVFLKMAGAGAENFDSSGICAGGNGDVFKMPTDFERIVAHAACKDSRGK